MWHVGHGFGATSYNCRSVAGHYGLSGKDDGLEGGGADFVDRGADSRVWHARLDGTLAGRILAEAGYVQYRSSVKTKPGELAYFAERTLPKYTSSTSPGLTLGTRSKAAVKSWPGSLGAQESKGYTFNGVRAQLNGSLACK